jgi:hypothetical protein
VAVVGQTSTCCAAPAHVALEKSDTEMSPGGALHESSVASMLELTPCTAHVVVATCWPKGLPVQSGVPK